MKVTKKRRNLNFRSHLDYTVRASKCILIVSSMLEFSIAMACDDIYMRNKNGVCGCLQTHRPKNNIILICIPRCIFEFVCEFADGTHFILFHSIGATHFCNTAPQR